MCLAGLASAKFVDVNIQEQRADTPLLIRAERLDLLFHQSSRAAYTGMIMALLLAAMLWDHTDNRLVVGWVFVVAITGVSRLAIFISYNRRGPTLEQVPRWEMAYLATLMMYFAAWGFGGVLLLPEDSPVYRVLICYFLIGMAGSAISVFSANRVALVSSSFLVLSPVLVWLYLRGEPLELGMALGGTAFLLSSVYAARVLSTSLQQNIQLKLELLQAKREGDELTDALEEALDKANEASAAKTRFLASASHDLRQPIHSLSMLSAALGMRPLDEKSQKIAGGLNQSIDTLSHQLDALLDISKLDAGVVPVELSDLDLHLLLAHLRDEMAVVAVRRGIQIELECPQPCPVHTDPMLLERILRNLVNNAIHHNRDCHIWLRAVTDGSVCQLSVEDSGKGIDREEQEKIFEEFYQVDNPSRDRSQGLGLGLAIIQRLQALLKLDMQFSSTPGQGTHFSFVLPMVAELEDKPSLPAGEDVALQGLRVLVVDDEASVRDSMAQVLEGLGCEPRVAANSSEALSMLGEWLPMLALVDYRLREDLNGLQVIEILREQVPDLPGYLITGDVSAFQVEAAREAGIEILHKPLSLEQLRTVLLGVGQLGS